MSRRLLPVLLALTAAAAGAASFDCKLARGKVETMVCADPGLSALDAQLGLAYARSLKAAADPSADKAGQLAWLRTRNACADAACLRQAYTARIAALQGGVERSTRSASAVKPAPAADCDGLPRLNVKTAPGFCLGLVADGLKAARGLAVLPDGGIVVADMGSWDAKRGRIWLLRRAAHGYAKSVLFDGLDHPNGVALGPDGKVYVGMPGRIARFAPGDAKPVLADVIGGTSSVAALPSRGRHLLPGLLFDAQGRLVVSVGSASDHCENAEGAMMPGTSCSEREGRDAVGVIRRYAMQWPAGKAGGWELLARGLRNSMAMAVEPRSGQLWQADNGRDNLQAAMPGLASDDDLPHDELNLVVSGADYGWPYCYDNGVRSPEYPGADCRAYRSPIRLLPAHAAPLGMAFYTAGQFPPAFRNSLLITYHGYRKHGHRVVALFDEGGPVGTSVTLVEGERGAAPGLGAPVGIAVGPDGNVYIGNDHGGLVARLHYGAR